MPFQLSQVKATAEFFSGKLKETGMYTPDSIQSFKESLTNILINKIEALNPYIKPKPYLPERCPTSDDIILSCTRQYQIGSGCIVPANLAKEIVEALVQAKIQHDGHLLWVFNGFLEIRPNGVIEVCDYSARDFNGYFLRYKPKVQSHLDDRNWQSRAVNSSMDNFAASAQSLIGLKSCSLFSNTSVPLVQKGVAAKEQANASSVVHSSGGPSISS